MATSMLEFLNQSTKAKLAKTNPFSNGQFPAKIPILGQSSAKDEQTVVKTENKAQNANKPMTMGEFLKPAVAQAASDYVLEEKDRQKLDGIVQRMVNDKQSDANIRMVVEDFKQKYGKTSADTPVVAQPEENSPGFVQSVAQSIAKPFLKTAATVKGFTDSTGALFNYLSGNKEAAKIGLEEADKGIDAGPLGKAEPIKSTKEAIGTGFELASNVVGGGAVKNVAGATIKGQVLRGVGKGMTGGAAAGFTGGMGRDLQEGETVGNSAAQGVMEGIVGSVLGGVVGAAGPIVGRVVRKAAGFKSGVKDVALNQSIANTARKIEGTGNNTGNNPIAFGKRMAQKVAESNERSVALLNEAPQVKVAADVGIGDDWLGMVKGASKQDVEAMDDMIQMAKNNQGKFIKDRPVAIAGKSVIDRVNFLKGKRTAIGKAIGDVKKNLPDNQVDITGEADDFAEKLNGMGISIGKGGKLNFADSELNNPYSGEDKRLIEFIWGQIKPDENGVAFRTPKQLDLIRGRIKNSLSAKPKNVGETTYAETLAGNLRKSFKGRVAETSKAYAKLSNQYAEITRALQDFYGLIQKEWTGKSGEMLNMRAGEVMSRILGNAAAKPQFVLEQLEEVAQKAGRDKLDDPLYQIAFSDLLEDVFGQTQTRSLPGQVERATMSAKEKIDLASGLKNPLATAGKIIEKLGPGDKQRQQALEDLIKYYKNIKK